MKYPIGIQTFEKLRAGGFVYVDKTEYIYRLVQDSNCCFLSRPRRFGKSLLLSTMESYFTGRKDLFTGLAVEKLEKDWIEYPVLHLDLSGKYKSEEDLNVFLNVTISKWERLYGADPNEETFDMRFNGVIERAYKQKKQKVVVLVDEYDNPLLEAFDNVELYDKFRDTLRGLYSKLKSQDRYIRFVFLTGITKFGKMNIFSGLNNLKDISMDLRYDAICGITEKELHTYFEESINSLAKKTGKTYDETCDELEKQYDGYHFHHKGVGVYNPFSLLNAFDSGEIGSYWFETGTPTFLVRLLQQNNYDLDCLDGVRQSADSLNDVTTMYSNPIPIIYQSGYLTINGYDGEFNEYELGYPNKEVENGFIKFLTPFYFSPQEIGQEEFSIKAFVLDLRSGNPQEFMERLQALYEDGDCRIAGKMELYFHNTLALFCKLLGMHTEVERTTSRGRADIVVQTRNFVYILELKLDGSAEAALQQINDKGYANRFAKDSRKLYKIGVNFSSATRSIDNWVIA